MTRTIPAPAAVAVIVVLVAIVVLLGMRMIDLQRRVDALAHPSATSKPSSVPSPSGASAAPSSSVTPSPTVNRGPGEIGGALWYPPTTGAGSIVIAPEGAADSASGHADVVVAGSADDEINAAIASLANGGGQVTLLVGRYEVASPVTIGVNGVALVGTNVGNGAGYSDAAIGSMLVPAEGFPAGEFLVRTTSEAYGPLISLLHLDGLDRAQGLNVESRRPTVTLNAVSQSSDTGMRFAGESTGNRPYDGFVLFNRVFDGAGIGILNDERSGDMLLEGNVVFRNEGDGFRCYGASQMYRVNHAYNNGGVGLRIIPGCVRTRLTANKWEGNLAGGLSIEGGSGFTVIGDTFAHNENDQADPPAHIEIGVRGEVETTGVMLWGLSFGKGGDDNDHLIHVGPLGRQVHLGPVHSAGGHVAEPYRVDDGGELLFYESVPELVWE